MTDRRPHPRRLGAVVAVLATAVAMAGCTSGDDTATATASPVVTPTATAIDPPTPTPTADAGPALSPEGTAADNLEFFTQIVADVWAGDASDSGRAYIDALTAGGFDKAQMQVTQDASTVGNQAESLQFSVRWGEDCLIGQVGPATGDPVTVVAPGLAAGGCLIGETRAIDW